eukprot:1037737-Ditylum_brightwellii.AAC.1
MPPFPNHWWSEPLHKVHLIVKYWEMVISFQWNNIDGTAQLDNLEKKLDQKKTCITETRRKTL